MSSYRWTGSGTFHDRANDRGVEPGEVVEIDDTIARGWSEFVEVEEPEADEDGYTCVGNDGECSRDVDTEGGRCWQHSDD